MKLDEVTVLQGFVSSPHEMWILVDPSFNSASIDIYIYIQYLYLFIYDIFTRSCFIEEDGNPGKVRG